MATTFYEEADERGEGTRSRPTRRGLIVRLLVVLILLGAVGGGLWFFNEFRRQAISQFFASNVPPPTPVAAVPAEVGPLPQFLGGIGTIAPLELGGDGLGARSVGEERELVERLLGLLDGVRADPGAHEQRALADDTEVDLDPLDASGDLGSERLGGRPGVRQRGRGEVDRGHLPAARGEPERVGPVPAAGVERDAGRQVVQLLGQVRIGRTLSDSVAVLP